VIELLMSSPLTDRESTRHVKAFKSVYDQYAETGEVDIQVQIQPGVVIPTVSASRPIHSFSNSDQTIFFRIESRKFHWSILPPYQGWESFEQRVVADLGRLTKKTGMPKLDRIGVRYTNRIDVLASDVASNVFPYEEYLSVNLELPPLLDPHSGYAWRIEKPFFEGAAGATVVSSTVPPELPGTIGVLLDTDVYVTSNLPTDAESLIERLRELRKLKNEIFEACITDKARASFQ